jgi:uncharacterized protein YbjT (DUF2867 family)
MNVVLFGATGMVGAGVLKECLEDSRVSSVLVVGRTPCGVAHPKVTERIAEDFLDYGAMRIDFRGKDACFFCLGASSAGMNEADYTRVTYELTLAAARALVAASPGMTFCYVTGLGTDSSERGRSMWARVKGRTENALLAMPFKAAIMFRPAFILPMKGVRSKTGWYQAVYNVMAPFYPLLRRLFPAYMTTTENLGKAMIEVTVTGSGERILYSRQINALAGEQT